MIGYQLDLILLRGRLPLTIQLAMTGYNRQHIRWKAPMVGMYKLNKDAALDMRQLCVGMGLAIRDHAGNVMATSAQRIDASFTPQLAEAIAILRGLQFAIETGLFPILVESDALEVVNLVNSASEISADFGLVVCDIKDL
ncbi:hypothetical protein Dsin_015825 [Dipteronia sinensis]|uniref:RNase H type-1 domain-containing protein n=1 Tax=Dipteronia sinensis TaxID=43782 RepID=A0AAE0AC13_9ROSI|nr:hypothetical protein Dsin_015825 [Dipteronia sinensis]